MKAARNALNVRAADTTKDEFAMLVDATTEDRFWAKVDKFGPLPTVRASLGNCWVWTAKKGGYGGRYGRFWVSSKDVQAHRFAYELMVGAIPDGMTIDHLCQNPPCVRASHLEPVPIRENVLRSSGLTAQNARVTHCRQGHPYDQGNTLHYRGHRYCITCRRESEKRRWQKSLIARAALGGTR